MLRAFPAISKISTTSKPHMSSTTSIMFILQPFALDSTIVFAFSRENILLHVGTHSNQDMGVYAELATCRLVWGPASPHGQYLSSEALQHRSQQPNKNRDLVSTCWSMFKRRAAMPIVARHQIRQASLCFLSLCCLCFTIHISHYSWSTHRAAHSIPSKPRCLQHEAALPTWPPQIHYSAQYMQLTSKAMKIVKSSSPYCNCLTDTRSLPDE